jgi:hypothetical protein
MSVAARIAGNAGVCTILTTLDVTTELRRAIKLDRTHGTSLAKAYVPGVGRAPSLSMPTLDAEEAWAELEPARGLLRQLSTINRAHM